MLRLGRGLRLVVSKEMPGLALGFDVPALTPGDPPDPGGPPKLLLLEPPVVCDTTELLGVD